MRDAFVSEETQQYILEDQQATVRKQRAEVAAIRLRNLKRAEDDRKRRQRDAAVEAYKKLACSTNPKHRRLEAAMSEIVGDLDRGKPVTTEQLRRVQSLMNKSN